MNPTGDLWSRKQLFEKLGTSDSNERRKRKQGGPDWPPHLCIGKKVFYRRDAVAAWLRRQEANCQAGESGFGAHSADDATMAPLRRHAKEPAENALPLNPQQIALMKSLLACLAEVTADE
jgi:hypothetical protein